MKACYKSDRLQVAAVLTVLFFGYIGVSHAQVQTWRGGGANAIWSTNAANWEGESVWVNGNSAIFDANTNAVFNGMVDVAATVTVANVTFQTNGYVIADADGDGTLTVTGVPTVITVVNAGHSGTVSEVIAGSGGLTKTGDGLLNLTATNTFFGTLRISSGVARLNRGSLYALGAGGTGNETIVDNGATLDFNGAYTNAFATSENLIISGSGVDGLGVLVNTGAGFMNGGFGTLTLVGNSTIGCMNRIDLRNTVTGNGYTLTKGGVSELAVGVAVTNCAVVINAGRYTYMNALALGTSDFDTTLNGGDLRSYGTYVVTERLIGNRGALISAGPANTLFTIAGRVTLNSNIVATAENGTSLELSGLLEGAGGITRSNASGSGNVYVTGNTNTYTGPTWVSSGVMWVGRTNVYSGVLGFGTVTNSGTLYGYSPLLCQGNLVNLSTLYCTTGSLVSGASSIYNGSTLYWTGGLLGGAGPVTNNATLYVDRGGAFVSSNGFFGTGNTVIRYGGDMAVSGSYSSNGTFRVAAGTLTLTNGAQFVAYSRFYLADRSSGVFPVDPTNVTATLNLTDGSRLETFSLEAGNGSSVTGGGMTNTVNQTGGTLRTFGWSGDPGNFPGEYDGLRIAHYPQAYGVYNLSGGTVIVDNGYRLSVAVDGTGWFRQTGGEAYASEVVVNGRNGSGGYGRLTLENGVFNVGSNGITVGIGAPYLVEYGGAGGIVRASTNFSSSLNATLYGTNANAITFDTTNWTITLSGKLTGTGGLNKAGPGTLVLSGSNTYSGATRVLEGRLTPASDKALPAGGVVEFGVSADDSGGQLYVPGDLSLSGLTVGVANPEVLNESKSYTIATYGGEVTGLLAGDVLPGPWYVYRDVENKRVLLRAAIGTMIRLR